MRLDVVGRRKLWFGISGALMAFALVASLVLGVKRDVQFSGGSISTYSYQGTLDVNAFQKTVEDILGRPVTLREQQDVRMGTNSIVITLTGQEAISLEEQAALTQTLEENYPDNAVVLQSTSNVSPSIGRDFFYKSLAAVAFASLMTILYIGFRFRKMDGVSAGVISVLALLHDAVVAYAVFVACGFPLNDSFIAVILTILGYSINNTIIIYDRIRENKRLLGDRLPHKDLVNISINQSLRRSVNTTVTTVVAMLCVCVVSVIYDVQSILTFSLPLLVGLLAGFFSSVFISGSLWCWWQERKLKSV